MPRVIPSCPSSDATWSAVPRRNRAYRPSSIPCRRRNWLSIVVVIVGVCGGLGAVAAAAAPRVLPPGERPDDARLGPLKNLDGYFPLAVPATVEAWEARAAYLRRQVRVSQGIWPEPERTALNAVVHGLVERPEYTVEKVYFESLPGHFVTGNLYRPQGRAGPLPGVLCPHGHWAGGRFQDHGPKEIRKLLVAGEERFERGGRHVIQSRCVQLARMGCVVFHYDMEGYADSRQMAHRAGVRERMSQAENWGFFSPQAELRLQTMMGLQTWNSIRALDFLTELPEVDDSRLGVTGASGGGTQTFVLTAVDPRPTVAFPAVMVSTAMQGGCTCENACYLRVDTGNIELAALFAPKPLALSGADDWTREIMTKGYPELKQLYTLLGVPDRVSAKALLQFGHNYNYVSRATMYSWFNQHLGLGLEEPVVEEDYEPLSEAQMSVWDEAHSQPPGGDDHEREVTGWLTRQAAERLAALTPRDAASLAAWREVVGGAVEVLIGHGLPDPAQLSTSHRSDETENGVTRSLFLLRATGEGSAVPVAVLRGEAAPRRAVVWLDPRGKAALFDTAGQPTPEARRLVAAGYAVVGIDLFGQGEFLGDDQSLAEAELVHPAQKELDGYAGYTFGYNHSTFARRVHDVLGLVRFLRSAPAAENPAAGVGAVDLVGVAGAGHWAAAARALAGESIERLAVDTGGFRFAQLSKLSDPDFLPGAVKYGDLPALVALGAPGTTWLAGEGGTTSLAEIIPATYAAAGRPEALTVYSGEADRRAALVEWLVEGR